MAEVIDEKVEYTQPAANPTSVTRSLNSIQEIKEEQSSVNPYSRKVSVGNNESMAGIDINNTNGR